MRITAGRFKGRTLAAPADSRVRPTSDKVRQAIFNVLEHHDFGTDAALQSLRVIDVFAGTGALGLEAMSRGATFCLFVEDGADSRALIRRNVEAFGLTGATKIWRRDAAALGVNSGPPYGLAFLDPPYRKGLAAAALASLRDGLWLASGALAVVETAKDEDPPSVAGYETMDERLYGDTRVQFVRFTGAGRNPV